MKDLKGKVAVVTGGASGLGFGIAQRLADEGMSVVLADIEAGALEAAVDALVAPKGDVIGVVCDVSKLVEVEALRDRAIAEFGGVHVVCNNAGVVVFKPVWEMTSQDWDWILGVNLRGVINGVSAFVPAMIEAGEPAHVVNTSSMAGFMTLPGLSGYTTTKRAVVGLTETLASDLEAVDAPIGVSVVCPGYVATPLGSSERNRPTELGGGLDEVTGSEDLEWPSGRVAPGDVVDEEGVTRVADLVVDAILNDKRYVFTHTEHLPSIRARFDAVLEGY